MTNKPSKQVIKSLISRTKKCIKGKTIRCKLEELPIIITVKIWWDEYSFDEIQIDPKLQWNSKTLKLQQEKNLLKMIKYFAYDLEMDLEARDLDFFSQFPSYKLMKDAIKAFSTEVQTIIREADKLEFKFKEDEFDWCRDVLIPAGG